MFVRCIVRPLVVAVVLAVAGSPVSAQRDEPTKSQEKVLDAFKPVVAKSNASIVEIVSKGKRVALGTVVGADGWVLTKKTLLPESAEVKLANGKTLPAKVVGVRDDYDLVMLKVEATNLKPVEWKPTKEAEVGDWVVTPGLNERPLAVGVLSVGTRRMGKNDYPRQFNANAGFLGISPTEKPEDGGVKIATVQPNTAASKAGLKVGDIILTINEKPIKDAETLLGTLSGYKANDVVTVKIKREGKEEEIKATLGKRPADRGDFQNRLGNEMSERRTGFPAILQHDTVVKPDECGGPLVDLDGKALGVNIARAGRTESYAIPSENLLVLVPDLKSGKFPPPVVDVTKVSDKVRKLQKEVADVESRVKTAEQLVDALKKLHDDARATAEKFGRTNPKLLDVVKSSKAGLEEAEKALAEVKDVFAKAQAELKKAQDEEKK